MLSMLYFNLRCSLSLLFLPTNKLFMANFFPSTEKKPVSYIQRRRENFFPTSLKVASMWLSSFFLYLVIPCDLTHTHSPDADINLYAGLSMKPVLSTVDERDTWRVGRREGNKMKEWLRSENNMKIDRGYLISLLCYMSWHEDNS